MTKVKERHDFADKAKKLTKEMNLKNSSRAIINGVEVELSEYYKNPQLFNNLTMNDEYISSIQEHHEKSIQDKERLQIDIANIKAFN